jgi:hypothetical protein
LEIELTASTRHTRRRSADRRPCRRRKYESESGEKAKHIVKFTYQLIEEGGLVQIQEAYLQEQPLVACPVAWHSEAIEVG